MKKFFKLFFIFLYFFSSNIFALEKVEINTATLQQLDEITGIGPVMAQRIIDARPFSSVDDLLKVKGIGEKTLQKIKDQGLAYVENYIAAKAEILPAPAYAPEIMPEIIYPDGVIINEILPSPDGADEENEFIEIYNSNNFEVDLSGWKIQDTEGTITTLIISKDEKILANEYLVFTRPETKISLNNSGDTISLLFPNDKIANSISFTKALLGQSYNKTENSWAWSKTITPEKQNIILAELQKPENQQKIAENKIIEKNLASISDSINSPLDSVRGETARSSGSSPWVLFYIVLGVAIILSIVVLIIKLRYYEYANNDE